MGYRAYRREVRARARDETAKFIEGEIVGFIVLGLVGSAVGFFVFDDKLAKFLGAIGGVLLIGIASVALAYLWNLRRAPALIHDDLITAHFGLNKLFHDSVDKRLAATVAATQFHIGQVLRMRTLTSDAEVQTWVDEARVWVDEVNAGLVNAETAVFSDFTGLDPTKPMPGSYNERHSRALVLLDRRLSNLLKIVNKRGDYEKVE